MSDQASVPAELLEILRCPIGVHMEGDDPGKLELVKENTWLFCKDSGCNYPIKDGIPVMLPEVGKKYKDKSPDELPAANEAEID